MNWKKPVLNPELGSTRMEQHTNSNVFEKKSKSFICTTVLTATIQYKHEVCLCVIIQIQNKVIVPYVFLNTENNALLTSSVLPFGVNGAYWCSLYSEIRPQCLHSSKISLRMAYLHSLHIANSDRRKYDTVVLCSPVGFFHKSNGYAVLN